MNTSHKTICEQNAENLIAYHRSRKLRLESRFFFTDRWSSWSEWDGINPILKANERFEIRALTDAIPEKPGELERRTLADWCYILQLVNCGKGKCRLCSGIHYKHGPYWYGYRRIEGKMRSIYVGKTWRPIDSTDGFDDAASTSDKNSSS
jgi:hypothetical protein